MNKTTKKDAHFISSRVVKTENGYGLFISCEKNGNRVYPDIMTNPDRLYEFSQLINRSEVSKLHIEEILEDFLE